MGKIWSKKGYLLLICATNRSMKTIRIAIVSFLLITTYKLSAQLIREPMTASDVEKEVAIWYNYRSASLFYPYQDSMRSAHVKKIALSINMQYGKGASGKARVSEKFDAKGRPISSLEKDGPFWKSRTWSTKYNYSSDSSKIYMTIVNPATGIRTDSVIINSDGNVKERYIVELRMRTNYVYRESDGVLQKIITTDSSGAQNITTITYNSDGFVTQLQDLYYHDLRSDTMVFLNITRDVNNDILHYDYLDKYQLSFNEEDPSKSEYWWTYEDYTYDSSHRILTKMENNTIFKSTWKTTYQYENGKLKREEKVIDSVTTVRAHFWNANRDSVSKTAHHKNYLGHGPAVINNGYDIILHNAAGQCTEYTEYNRGFGHVEFANRTIFEYDKQNRVIRRDFYEYDYMEKKVVYRTGYTTQYYPNGLQKSFISYGANKKFQSSSRYKYHYHR